jgi:hypothetical protein
VDGSFAFFLLILALFGVAGGLQGRSKGSSFVLWFFISACVPLFGFIAAVVYPGHRSELRRQCDGCGRLLPITDTMCMGCGTDLDFPEVRYLPADVRPPAPAAVAEEDDEDEDGPDDGAPSGTGDVGEHAAGQIRPDGDGPGATGAPGADRRTTVPTGE